MYGKPDAPAKEAILAARDRVLARYPGLRVVGCHLGSNEDDLNRLAKRLDAYPNFSVDTRRAASATSPWATGTTSGEFLTRYQDRILYATDFSHRGGDAVRGPGVAGHARPRLGLLLPRRHGDLRRPPHPGARPSRRAPPEDLP